MSSSDDLRLAQCNGCGKFIICSTSDLKQLMQHACKEHSKIQEPVPKQATNCQETIQKKADQDLISQTDVVSDCVENQGENTDKPNNIYIKTLRKWRPYRRTSVLCPACSCQELPLVTTHIKHWSRNSCVNCCLKMYTPSRCILPCVKTSIFDKLCCCQCGTSLGVYLRECKKTFTNNAYLFQT